jgi:Raf kinase inhibitor-like YbhB/YbcL family protein
MFRLVAVAAGVAIMASSAAAAAFELESPDFPRGGSIPNKHVYKGFGCEGENVSPALRWSNPPAGTRSFALLVHDPDAPTGGAGWWHWVVYNLPPQTNSLPQGAGTPGGEKLPSGASQVRTDFGAPGWGGPCPPAGHKPHRYNFMLHALKVDKLEIPQGATASLVGFMVNANSIGQATLTGTYGR